MKKLFSILPLLYTGFCFSQNTIEYANFIQTDTSVKWAAVYHSYVSLTPVNPNFSTRNYYLKKLNRQGATAYLEDTVSFAVTPLKISYAEYLSTIKPVNYDAAKMNWYFDYDNKHDASEIVFNRDSNACDTCTGSNKLSFFKVKQLLYYKANQFKIQNILLTPVIYKKEALAFKEEAQYFETSNFAFNEIKTDNVSIPAAAKFIGRSCNNLVLLPFVQSENKILTIHNWSLSNLLYKDIKKKILKAYNADNSVYPDLKNVLDHRRIEEYKNMANTLTVPEYDSLGEIKGYKTILSEINFDSIYNFTLIQDFYFDFDKEILYSKLVSLLPRIRVVTSQGVSLGLTNYWGVIFPEEKKKIIKKTK